LGQKRCDHILKDGSNPLRVAAMHRVVNALPGTDLSQVLFHIEAHAPVQFHAPAIVLNRA